MKIWVGIGAAALVAASVAAASTLSTGSPDRPNSPAREAAPVIAGPRTAVTRPAIRQWRIPFGAARKRETAGYARRHYGIDSWRVRGPHVIVQHFTASNSLEGAHATFAANAPDAELGERPGVCSHFLIGRDGRIYQLVPLEAMCRHTVGLNWASIGIEHVAVSDAQILGNRAQLDASLRLTLWLMEHNRIRLRDVIGHSESLRSPYRRERYTPWRCQTHADWGRASMVRYRAGLRSRAASTGLSALAPRADLGGPRGSTSGC